MTMLIHGMRVRYVVQIILAPPRRMPCFWASSPTMNPGSSAKYTIGRWKVSHSCRKRMTFCPAAISMELPRNRGLWAMTPTG